MDLTIIKYQIAEVLSVLFPLFQNEEDIRTSLSREINNRHLGNAWNVITVFTRYQGEATDDLLLKVTEIFVFFFSFFTCTVKVPRVKSTNSTEKCVEKFCRCYRCSKMVLTS